MIRINDIIDKMFDFNTDADVDIVDRAYIYSARVHDGQTRLSGEPYLTHPLEVAAILADMKLDAVSVAAGLLHDVIEDTHATHEEIGDMFGPEVLHIVSGVTKLSKLPFDTALERQAENLRKMLLAMADDIRVILIKLADRIHNMRTLNFHGNESKKKKIAQETLDIYAPLASRLGIYWIKKELEDTAFMYLEPEEYERIKNLVSKDKAERETYIKTVVSLIKKEMEAAGLECEVKGRYKHFYSIWQKMKTQELAFEDVYDIIAFRIILDTKPKCYEALGILHALWKPVDSKFKDYIGRPKQNMYQSLHTTVIGPSGERIEIQIRTHEMDSVAKSGIAAHWSYKEGNRPDEKVSRQFAWIQDLIENQENVKDPNEFLENVRIDLFPDDVYVFTPVGDVKALPRGGTPVDFAYLIHSEVGSRCTSAKVNGRIVPLKYELQTGDVVEIITSKGHEPSRDWLAFVRTVKARSKIRQWIRTQEKERSISLGREMCEKAFRKHRLNYNVFSKSEDMQTALEQFNLKTADDLLASVGYGKITPLQIIRKLQKPDHPEEEKTESSAGKAAEQIQRKKARAGVVVRGVDDILIRFGKCCLPVPGDSITGYITHGHGVTVHKIGCVNAVSVNPERQIEVEWNEEIKATYPVKIHVLSHDRVGLLADLAVNISKNGANIISVNSRTAENKMVDSYFLLSVRDIAHLDKVLSAIRKVKQIVEVRRTDG
ncbi:MAG: GTP pyrophosphokinase [Desulfobacteraceae bacterium IS3]|nr:MAG: GTP pyrophosphokinase [Desulfobacteraceae bacterium IS3]